MNLRVPRVIAQLSSGLEPRTRLRSSTRWVLGLLGAWAILGLGAGVRTDISAAESGSIPPDTAAMLYPPANAALTNETVRIVGVSLTGQTNSTLTLDGQPLRSEPYTFTRNWPKKNLRDTNQPAPAASPLLDDKTKVSLTLASPTLSPGAHLLVFAGITHRLVRLPPGIEAEATNSNRRAIFRPHPSANDPTQPVECAACHDLKSDTSALGRARLPGVCTTCHTPVDLRLTHSHVMEPLAKCTLCHDPHGSARPSLLLDDKARLCTQCHEAGHSRN